MSYYQATMPSDELEAEAASALLHLRDVLALVEQMADEAGPAEAPAGIDRLRLDEAATLALAYAGISSVARRRFDALAGEAAGFSTAGLAALIQHKQRFGRDCQAGARQLAKDMRQSIEAMTRMLEASGRR